MNKKVRIGILLNGYYISAWAYAMLENIIKDQLGDIVLLVIKKEKLQFKDKLLGEGKIVNTIFRKIDRWGFKDSNDAFDSKSIRNLCKPPELYVENKGSNEIDSFSDFDLKKIEDHEIDILIKLGFNNLSGGILSCAKYGVWSIEPEDFYLNKKSFSGFWEVVKNENETVIELHSLTEIGYPNKILFTSSGLTDRLSIERNNNKNYWKASLFIPRELRRINSIGHKAYTEYLKKLTSSGIKIMSTESNVNNFLLFLGIINLQLRRISEGIKGMASIPQWLLLYKINSNFEFKVDYTSFKRIEPPSDRIWADPHVLIKDDKYYIFIEELFYSENKGHISVIEMDENGNFLDPQIVLEEDYHLSYPFVIRDKGEIYMIPETNSNNTIQIYKCVEFPKKWEFHKVLMNNIIAVDTTIFVENGKYWLFTNIAKHRGASTLDELFLFYSDNLLADNWVSHPKNPIVSDVKSARCAGNLFYHNNHLYRPSQNCSKRYGYGLQFNHILELNEKNYREEIVKSIFPEENNNIRATHTFSQLNNLSVVDIQRKIKRKIKI